MTEPHDLFEEHRAHLHAVAFRVLGSHADADDAVQEAWLRFDRADRAAIENPGGWLTTVTARVCLDRLRVRRDEVEEAAGELPASPLGDPEGEALLADSVGEALSVVVAALAPSERVAFVLHDVFGVSFAEIGVVLGRSPNAAKQLASRARARIRGAAVPVSPPPEQRRVVEAFLAAARAGDLAGLVAVLDPDVVLTADSAAVRMGAPDGLRGAGDVAQVFSGRALGAQPAVVDGRAGFAWTPKDRPSAVWEVEVVAGSIVRIDMLAAAATLAELDLSPYLD